MGIHENVASGDDLWHQQKAIASLAEYVISERFNKPYGDFKVFLDKVQEFSKTKNFKDFETVNKETFATYNYLAKYHDELLIQQKAIEDIGSTDQATKSKAHATLVALKYKFEGDE